MLARSTALTLLGRNADRPCPGAKGIDDISKASLETIVSETDKMYKKRDYASPASNDAQRYTDGAW